MIPRLHIDVPLRQGGAAPLTQEQAHYLRNVLRREAGAEIAVFNARDGEYAATIAEIGKKSCIAAIGAQLRKPHEEPDIQLLFAPLKRAPTELIVQKATELGASRLSPVMTERTNTERLRIDRLAVIAREAAEQCERLSVPEIDAPHKLSTLLDDWDAERALIYCDEAGDNPEAMWGGVAGRAAPVIEALAEIKSRRWGLLVGPEGGFSPAERDRLRAADFVTPVTLGPRILRADTAAIAALTLVQASVGDFRRRN